MLKKINKSFFLILGFTSLVFATNAQMNLQVTTLKNVTCNGGSDGEVSVTVTGSTPGAILTYQWNGNSLDTIATTITISNLVATPSNFIGVTDNTTNLSKAGNYTILQPVGAKYSYPSLNYCKDYSSNPSPTISFGNVAGTFTSSPAGLSINSSTGLINIASSNAGNYTVTNTVTGLNGCPDATQNKTITINEIPKATFSFSTPVCKSASNPSPVMAIGATKGTFSSDSPNLKFVSASIGQVDLSNSDAGTYTITNTISAAGGCPSTTSNSTITISDCSLLGIEEIKNENKIIYPNPAKDILNISENIKEISISNSTSEVLKSSNKIETVAKLDPPHFPPFFVEVSSNGTKSTSLN